MKETLKDKTIFSTHQVAKICNVHYTTVIGWVEAGKLQAYATPGGHRRIKRSNLLKFMKECKLPIPEQMTNGKKRILIVDDDSEALDELNQILQGENVDIDLASSSFEAGRKIYRKVPDLILLDFRMPGMNGFEVCEVLHRDPKTEDIPIFAITVLNSEKDIKRIMACGVKEYIPKPVDPEKLIKLVKKVLMNN